MVIIFLLSTSFVVRAQLIESFDDVNMLQTAGWIFDNRSDFPTKVFWAQGIESLFSAHSGSATSYIFNTTASGADLVCNWLIMPDVGSIDQLSFYTRSQNNSNEVTRMLVMYSPTGTVNTGDCTSAAVKSIESKGGNDFGDFQTLLSINQNQDTGGYPQEWTEYTVDVNGNGRIAFLYYVETGAPNFNSGTLAIDTISRGAGSPIPGQVQVVPTINDFGLLMLLSLIIIIGIIKTGAIKT